MWPEKSSPRSNLLSLPHLRLGFLDHLEELRWRLLASLAALGIFSVGAYFFSSPLLEFLTLPLRELREGELYFHAPYEAFLIRLQVSLGAGLVAASPVFLTELWIFLSPGLHRGEKRLVLSLLFISIFLFLAGAAFAFLVLVPFGLQFFLGFQTESLRPLLGIGPYLSFLLGTVLACGIVFDLPVVLLGLVEARVLSVETLRHSRKGVILLLFILAAVLTPSGDPASQILLALPLLLLYEGCVRVAGWRERRKKACAQQHIGQGS